MLSSIYLISLCKELKLRHPSQTKQPTSSAKKKEAEIIPEMLGETHTEHVSIAQTKSTMNRSSPKLPWFTSYIFQGRQTERE